MVTRPKLVQWLKNNGLSMTPEQIGSLLGMASSLGDRPADRDKDRALLMHAQVLLADYHRCRLEPGTFAAWRARARNLEDWITDHVADMDEHGEPWKPRKRRRDARADRLPRGMFRRRR